MDDDCELDDLEDKILELRAQRDRAVELLRGYTYPAKRLWETEVEEWLNALDGGE